MHGAKEKITHNCFKNVVTANNLDLILPTTFLRNYYSFMIGYITTLQQHPTKMPQPELWFGSAF
jgi:hypothetical protein